MTLFDAEATDADMAYAIFDVTDFVRQHPGGVANIMLAAGGKLLEKIWLEQAPNHFRSANVKDILKNRRIGYVQDPSPELIQDTQRALALADQLAQSKAMRRFLTKAPQNSEPGNGPQYLVADITLREDRFIRRNHVGEPGKRERIALHVFGRQDNETIYATDIPVEDLQIRYVQKQQPAVIRCGGDERAHKDDPAEGLDWEWAKYSVLLQGPELKTVLDDLLPAGLELVNLPEETVVRVADNLGFSSCLTLQQLLQDNGQSPLFSLGDEENPRLASPGHAGHCWPKDVEKIEVHLAPEVEPALKSRAGETIAKQISLCVSQHAYVQYGDGAPEYDSRLPVHSVPTDLLLEQGKLKVFGRAFSDGEKVQEVIVTVENDQGHALSTAMDVRYPFAETAQHLSHTGMYQLEAELVLPEGFIARYVHLKASTQTSAQPERARKNTRALGNNAIKVFQISESLKIMRGPKSLWRHRQDHAQDHETM
ncbi:MAG: cytochrome b5 domain-containing protein [Janthinobacterium lividum]